MKLSRRSFLALSGCTTAAASLAGLSPTSLAKDLNSTTPEKEQAFYTACHRNCSSTCILKAYVKDGVVTRMGNDDQIQDSPENPQLRQCLRGWNHRHISYAPDRLKYPMKRIGKRGEGKFQRISWSEAFDIYETNLRKISDKYGTKSILSLDGSGVSNMFLHSTYRGVSARFLKLMGGGVEQSLNYSSGAAVVAVPKILGTRSTCSATNFLHAKTIFLWGMNVAETGHGTNNQYYLHQAKERGVKIYVVDPRYSDTAASYADTWVPVRPGADVALMSAMAWVILDEGLQDQAFLEKNTEGWQEWFDYINGKTDGQPKTPAWAEKVAGVEANMIRQMARDYASNKPATLIMGLGLQRTAFGEQVVRCGPALAALTGNIGMMGGYPGQTNWKLAFPRNHLTGWMTRPARHIPGYDVKAAWKVHCTLWADAILKGKEGGYQEQIRMAINAGGNQLNQNGDINKCAKALQCEKLEFFVVHEQFMTPTAKYADLLLPICSVLERADIANADGAAVYMPKLIEPLHESRSDWQIFSELARRFGKENLWHDGKTEEQILEAIVNDAKPGFPDWKTFKSQQIFRYPPNPDKPIVPFETQIKDNTPFKTPSGKIEISSRVYKEQNNPGLPAIPEYLEERDSPNDPKSKQYPLQLIGPHSKKRVHSSWDNVPWLQEVEPHRMWIHPQDAASRNIKTGDLVRIFNERGETRIEADVTHRIRPGVVALPQGVWYQPENPGVAGSIDLAGSINILTSDLPTPGGANAVHTCLVEVARPV